MQSSVDDLDLWAIKVVVRECRYMKLSRTEQVVAARLMRRKGWGTMEIATALRTSTDSVVQMYKRDKINVDLDELVEQMPEVVGPPVISEPGLPMTREQVRKVAVGC